MFERFTDRGRRVVVLAHQEAAGVGSAMVAPEHLILGMLAEGESLAAKVLSSAGLDYDKALTLVAEIWAASNEEGGPEPSFTPESIQEFDRAGVLASDMGHEFVTPEHLLISVIENATDSAAALFARLSVPPETIGNTLRRSVSESDRARLPATDMRDVPLGQTCRACGAAIHDRGRVKQLELGVENSDPISLNAYFCGECGSTIGLVKGS